MWHRWTCRGGLAPEVVAGCVARYAPFFTQDGVVGEGLPDDLPRRPAESAGPLAQSPKKECLTFHVITIASYLSPEELGCSKRRGIRVANISGGKGALVHHKPPSHSLGGLWCTNAPPPPEALASRITCILNSQAAGGRYEACDFHVFTQQGWVRALRTASSLALSVLVTKSVAPLYSMLRGLSTFSMITCEQHCWW